MTSQLNKMKDLGTVDSDRCSYGYGINRKRQVIGTSAGTCPYTAIRAFLWEDEGPMVDLNSLIPADSDLHLETPETINDRGEIAGTGSAVSDGNQHAFLLIPCDEEHPGVEGCDYSMVDATPAEVPQVNPGRAIPHNLPGTPRPVLPNGFHKRMRRYFTQEEAPRRELDDISKTFSPSGIDSARRCVKKGGQCYPLPNHGCCPGLVCSAASVRAYCE